MKTCLALYTVCRKCQIFVIILLLFLKSSIVNNRKKTLDSIQSLKCTGKGCEQ